MEDTPTKRGPGRPKKNQPPEAGDQEIAKPYGDKPPKAIFKLDEVEKFSMFRDEGNLHITGIRTDGSMVDEIVSLPEEHSVSVRVR